MILPALKFNISFHKKIRSTNSETFFFFNTIANALGTAITNIDDAPITLVGFRLENIFDTTNGIAQQLSEHYRHGLIKQLLKLIGSIEIIGNPVGLFTRISTGVVDLIEKPMEGMVRGPLELGIGVAHGAGSLIKHTFAGTFYSINKLTGSIATGVSLLSMVSKIFYNTKL